jgi:hypothetical protein
MRRNLIALLVLSVSFLVVAGNAHVAVSQTLPWGVYTIRQKSTGRYVDAHESLEQDWGLVIWFAQNNDTQRWLIDLL